MSKDVGCNAGKCGVLVKNNIVEVKESRVEGKGVFATCDIKKGEVVIKWHPKPLTADEIKSVPKDERNFIMKTEDGRFQLMQAPERYVNHSCEPNTVAVNEADVAVRDIDSGEEIFTDYGNTNFEFDCKCGSAGCRGHIGGFHV